MTSLARALSFAWEVHDAEADMTERVALGTALRSPSTPHAYDINALRVEVPTGLDLPALADAAAAAAPDVPYRRLRIEDEATAGRLVPAARAAGWKVELELVMLLDPDAAPSAPAAPPSAAVRDGSFDEVLGLMRAWYGEEGIAGVELEHCLRMSERAHRAKDERWFVADHEGRAAAMCTLRRDGSGVAQLEDVFVLPSARGHGLGAAVVHAARAAATAEGHEVVFIVADDEDWPKTLYARAGFTGPSRRRAILHRSLAA